MEKEINLKMIIGKVVALVISVIILVTFMVLDLMRFEIVNRTLISVFIGISLLFSGAAFVFIRYLTKFRNVYFQIVDFLFILNLAFIVVQLFFLLVLFPATVHQYSMYPTLVENDELIVLSMDKPERGEIVVCRIDYDINTPIMGIEDRELLVKRVIGVPGDTFYFEDGILYRNGKAVDEFYLKDENDEFFQNSKTRDFDLSDHAIIGGESVCTPDGECRLPDGYYFVMGDNRRDSVDSRNLGLFHKSQIMGVAKYRKIGFLHWEKLK